MRKTFALLLCAVLFVSSCSDSAVENAVPNTATPQATTSIGEATSTDEDSPADEGDSISEEESASETESADSADSDTGTDSDAGGDADGATSDEGPQDEGEAANDEGELAGSSTSSSSDGAVTPDAESTDTAAISLPVDPAVRIGTLANGLTYYLRSNESPGGSLSLRLAVNAGSLNEPFIGAGYAHYLEHMLFNGTKKYPGNEITDALQSIGIEFGPDINAYTSYDETVYKLDLIIDEKEDSVATAFGVLSEWAHAATISAEDVEEEQGIIRDEYRLRVESGDGKIFRVFDNVYTEGTPYEGRRPIGTIESITATTAQDLRTFYESWYVPSNMAVIAVGDLPVDTLQSLVEEYFDDIGAGEVPLEVEHRSAIDHDLIITNATSSEQAYPYLSLDIRLPSWDPGTIAGNRQLWIERIIASMVNNRLQDAYEQGFLSQIDPAFWSSFSHTRGLRYYGTNLRADNFATALTDYWSLLLSLAELGFSQADFDRASREMRAELQASVDAAATRRDTELAEAYTAHFLASSDISTPESRAARVNTLLDDLQIGELTERYRAILALSEPIIIGVAPQDSDLPTASELKAALEAAAPGQLPAELEIITQLIEPPASVEPSSEGPIETLTDELNDPYRWVFDNGAQVLYAYSGISENAVVLNAFSWGGWSLFSEGERPIAQTLVPRAVNASGLGSYSRNQLTAYSSENNINVRSYIGEFSEGVVGSSTTVGTEAMFQLMYLYVTAPRVDEQAFAEAINVGGIYISLAQSDPDVREIIALLQARHGDAYSWYNPIPSQEQLTDLTAEEMLDIYQKRLGGIDDLTVIVVGDVERDVVAELARTYVGTLPAKESDTYMDRRGSLPDEVVRQEVVLSPENQSTRATYIFETEVEINRNLFLASRVLQVILSTKLLNEVREELGESYGAEASVRIGLTPTPNITISALATGAPTQMSNIEAKMARILKEFHAGEISSEEFVQGHSVLSDDLELLTNSDIIESLSAWVVSGGDDAITHQDLIDGLKEITLQDVKEAAALLLDPNRQIQIVRVLPQ
ncbi:MAG: insulinase family protein [Acidimicrobiia bacterium]|nr:insulinase family protein [Acidimicrobiia bacterium]MYC58520.1 insulinase family protein [Acidimicrobiia bacterium]MYI30374.1 insulinase family protein [Acidimicrobiia bacterium]